MKPLPTKFDRVFVSAQGVRDWFDAKRKWLEDKLQAIKSKLSSWVPVPWFGFVACFLTTCVARVVSEDKHSPLGDVIKVVPFPQWGSWAVGIGFVVLVAAMIITWLDSKASDIARHNARQQYELELKGNPLYSRAELIMHALKDYRFHLDRYREMRHQVEEELVEPDNATAERYYAFIERANDVLTRAIANFNAVAERVARAEAYAAAHPELKEASESAGLSLLINELDGKVEQPQLPAPLLDPVKALEHEEDLARVVAELEQHEVGA